MPAAHPPRSVVLVEDNPDDAEVVCRALRQIEPPPAVTRFDDGTRALAHLLRLERPHLPAVILLDLTLPGAGGLSVLSEVRACRGDVRQVPVVILTSSKQPEDVVAAFTGGANAYVRKPLKFKEFVEGVKIVGDLFLRFNEALP